MNARQAIRGGVRLMLNERACRLNNAKAKLVDVIQEQFGFTPDHANKIADVFVKVKFAKLDAIMGQFTMEVPQAWNKEVMCRALAA